MQSTSGRLATPNTFGASAEGRGGPVEALAGVAPRACTLPLHSTVTGERVDGPEGRPVRRAASYLAILDTFIETLHLHETPGRSGTH